MKLQDAVTRYLTVLSITHAPTSTKTYRSRLKYLCTALGDRDVADITLHDLEQLVAKYRAEGRRNNTVRLFVTTLRELFRWAVDAELIDRSPSARLRAPRADHPLPRSLSQVALAAALDRIAHSIDTHNLLDVRNQTLVLLLAQSGLRRAEAVTLRWDDIDLLGHTIRVWGKGNRERILPLYSGLVPYLIRLRAAYGRDWGYVFAREDGSRLHTYTINMIFRRWVWDRTGLRITPHVLRHTFATMLIERGASLDEVRDLLGHVSIATTQIYVRTSPNRLRDAIERLGG